MQTAQNSSPTGGQQTLFPSPTYSDSTLSSGSNLCTPDQAYKYMNHDGSIRKDAFSSSISAANAAFMSATERDDFQSVFGSHMNAKSSAEAASSLASALDFDAMNADMASFINNPCFSFLGKRQASNNGTFLHARLDSGSGRRHSIQPLVSNSGELSTSSSMDLPTVSALHDTQARSMSLSADSSFDFGNMSGSTAGPGTDFLMSPPRLTVSMSSQHTPTASNVAEPSTDDSKRRRTSQVDATPDRITSAAQLLQQTPPNFSQYQHFVPSSAGSSLMSSQETPSTTAGTSSVQSSASSIRARRLSLSRGDSNGSEIAHLTAGMTIPSEARFNLQPPKSAPPRAASDAMQRAQAARSTPTKSNDKNNSDKNKSQDVWPDDVEVAFWEGESDAIHISDATWLFLSSFDSRLFPFFLPNHSPSSHSQAWSSQGAGPWQALWP